MFFREFDIPLKEIKAVLKNPALEKNQILRMQRKMLTAKKERIERLIASIDAILKGENAMDFEVFSKTELENLYRSMEENMNEDQKALFIEQYGSMSAWKEHFLKSASSKEAQKNFQKSWNGTGARKKRWKFPRIRETRTAFRHTRNRWTRCSESSRREKDRTRIPRK